MGGEENHSSADVAMGYKLDLDRRRTPTGRQGRTSEGCTLVLTSVLGARIIINVIIVIIINGQYAPATCLCTPTIAQWGH